jgi:hypothetical protein
MTIIYIDDPLPVPEVIEHATDCICVHCETATDCLITGGELGRKRGRPTLPPDERTWRTWISVTGLDRRDKLHRLGRAWLDAAIDGAGESNSQACRRRHRPA